MKEHILCLFLLLTASTIQIVAPANILFLYAFATFSHRTAVEPLAHKLVERGHNVTFICPVKANKPNPKIHEFVPEKVMQVYKESLTGFGDQGFPDRLLDKHANFMTGPAILDFTHVACGALFGSPEMKSWLESNPFDVIVMTHHSNKCGYAIAHKMKAKVIVMSATSFFTSEEDVWGLPAESSWLRRFAITNIFTDQMTFYDKLYNVLNLLFNHFYDRWAVFPTVDRIIQDFYGDPTIPSLEHMERYHTDLFFMNQHFSADFARSLPPMMIPVGGMHCTDEHQALPKDLSDFIEGAGDAGFIFVSFGSMVKMSKVPPHFIRMLFDAVRGMNTRFLWRWDTDPPADLPSNVFTASWFPQQDLLAHPKIKGFISHGGHMSTQQAIFHAVPMIIMPIVYDQPYNAMRVRHHGIGIHLELSELTTERFRDAVVQILENAALRDKMKAVSKRFRDRPMSPVDTAVYWTEYVLRHNDTSHLKPLGIHQTWWERRLLDVWAFLFTIIILLALLACKIAWVLTEMLMRKISSVTQVSKGISGLDRTKTQRGKVKMIPRSNRKIKIR